MLLGCWRRAVLYCTSSQYRVRSIILIMPRQYPSFGDVGESHEGGSRHGQQGMLCLGIISCQTVVGMGDVSRVAMSCGVPIWIAANNRSGLSC